MKTVVAAAIGECVHVAGVVNFLRLADKVGWRTIFIGPATPIEQIIETAAAEQADLVGVSYRLTPENGERLIASFAEQADHLKNQGVKFAFGGPPPMAAKARKMGFFDACFDGSETTEGVIAFLKGQPTDTQSITDFPQKTIERIQWKSPMPLIRHHFGLPDLEATRRGIEEIAESRMVDVISLGIDQDAQENFFNPERQDKRRFGAGGVPVRTAEDYSRLFAASRTGNYPLMRTYSGTDNFFRLAEMYVETINIAWAAVPLFWFNRMDGRGPWDLEGSIREHQQLMAWYGERNIPVEANEAHHWGMRDAHDVVFIVSAYLAACNAKAVGVKDHIIQLMFNSPPGTSAAMDIAKMLAVIEMVSPLASPNFRIWKQVRTGLLSYPVDLTQARAHLAVSVFNQMQIRPDIVHVVGYPEADHAVTATEVVESCIIARKAIDDALHSKFELTATKNIQQRVCELVQEAELLVEAIKQSGSQTSDDPLADPGVLATAVTSGLLDAPQLINNPYGRGEFPTTYDHRGACQPMDKNTREIISESERIQRIQSRRKDEQN
ncbi:MAG: cobalamin-dependent protein [Anaerolineales bacterium]|nr:cobalamin-dependent protein [Anaerolineales bacterium]